MWRASGFIPSEARYRDPSTRSGPLPRVTLRVNGPVGVPVTEPGPAATDVVAKVRAQEAVPSLLAPLLYMHQLVRDQLDVGLVTPAHQHVPVERHRQHPRRE